MHDHNKIDIGRREEHTFMVKEVLEMNEVMQDDLLLCEGNGASSRFCFASFEIGQKDH